MASHTEQYNISKLRPEQEYAALLLSERRGNVRQAAAAYGCSNMSHFSAVFKKKYGVLLKNFI